jgi:hypothetical protein
MSRLKRPFGNCGYTSKDINECGFKRDENADVYTAFEYGTRLLSDGKYTYDTLKSRYLYVPLFQDPKIREISTYKKLLDIIVEFQFSAYNGEEPIKILNEFGSEILLYPIRDRMYINMMIVQVLDETLAKKIELTPEEIFVNVDNPLSQLHKDKFEILAEQQYDASRETFEYEDYHLRMCFRFTDENTCIKSSERGENIIYTVGTISFVMFITYMPRAFEMRKSYYTESDKSRYEFGDTYDILGGSVGRSFIVGKLKIENSIKNLFPRGYGVHPVPDSTLQILSNRLVGMISKQLEDNPSEKKRKLDDVNNVNA